MGLQLCPQSVAVCNNPLNIGLFPFWFPGISERNSNESALSAGIVRPIKPSQSSRAPVSRLLNAAKARDFDLVDREMRKVESRASALRTLASSCAERTRNSEGVR